VEASIQLKKFKKYKIAWIVRDRDAILRLVYLAFSVVTAKAFLFK
jgi:hypothetical protein